MGAREAASLQHQQHPRVAQSVRLDVAEIQELGDTDVVGAAHLLENLGSHRGALDLSKPVPGEEFGLEGQHEQPLQLQVTGDPEKLVDDGVPDAASRHRQVDGDGAHLAEIGPQHMQCAATDHDALVLGHPELLDGFIQRHQVLFQQDLARVGVDEVLDHRDVGGSRAPDRGPLGRRIARCVPELQSIGSGQPGDDAERGARWGGAGDQGTPGDDADRAARRGAGNQVLRCGNRYSGAVSGQPQTGPVVPRVRVTNLANVLTLLRLVLVPVFLLALFAGNGHETASRIIAFVVFAVAVITDRFDGALARNYGMVTEFGTMADPIADKTLIGAALIGLSMLGDLHWWVTAVILAREVGITVLRFVMLRHGVIPASRGGKLKTLVQAVAIGMFVLPVSGSWLVAAGVGMAAAIVLTVLTGLDYVASAARDARGRPAAQ